MLEMELIHEREGRPKVLTKAATGIQEKEKLIRQDFSADKHIQSCLYNNILYIKNTKSLFNSFEELTIL